MFNFKFYTPTKVVFGKDTESKVAELINEFGGKKVLIHYGGGSVIRSGLMQRVTDTLDAAGINYIMLGGAVPNPHLGLVYEGIELCKKEGIDFILAVGGGSAIDSAKAIGYGVTNEGDVWDFYDYKREAKACLPIGVILTLAATGSEMSDSSVITKEEGLVKRGYSSDYSRPKFAIMNPELTMTLPDYQTACGCTDIMMHTMERYFTQGGNMEITDSIAEGLLRTVMNNAKILVKDPKNYEARAELMLASSFSHNGITSIGKINFMRVHGIEHICSGVYDRLAHGAGLSILWIAWCYYELDNKKANIKLERLAKELFNVNTAKEGIDCLKEFFKKLNMPTSFKDLDFDVDINLLENEYNKLMKPASFDYKPIDIHEILRLAN